VCEGLSGSTRRRLTNNVNASVNKCLNENCEWRWRCQILRQPIFLRPLDCFFFSQNLHSILLGSSKIFNEVLSFLGERDYSSSLSLSLTYTHPPLSLSFSIFSFFILSHPLSHSLSLSLSL